MISGTNIVEAERRSAIVDAVNSVGFTVVADCLSISQVELLRTEFPESASPERYLFAHETIRCLAVSHSVRSLVEPILGGSCFAVRAIFFNKTSDANWMVSWHQDLTIAVPKKRETQGFSSWSVKDGVTHVQPPADILEKMLAIRLHLDDNDAENGPLRCIPGSHNPGRLSNEQILALPKSSAVTCLAPAGSALLMRPLVVHASSSCTAVRSRRVIHLEYANAELPADLEWNERI